MSDFPFSAMVGKWSLFLSDCLAVVFVIVSLDILKVNGLYFSDIG